MLRAEAPAFVPASVAGLGRPIASSSNNVDTEGAGDQKSVEESRIEIEANDRVFVTGSSENKNINQSSSTTCRRVGRKKSQANSSKRNTRQNKDGIKDNGENSSSRGEQTCTVGLESARRRVPPRGRKNRDPRQRNSKTFAASCSHSNDNYRNLQDLTYSFCRGRHRSLKEGTRTRSDKEQEKDTALTGRHVNGSHAPQFRELTWTSPHFLAAQQHPQENQFNKDVCDNKSQWRHDKHSGRTREKHSKRRHRPGHNTTPRNLKRNYGTSTTHSHDHHNPFSSKQRHPYSHQHHNHNDLENDQKQTENNTLLCDWDSAFPSLSKDANHDSSTLESTEKPRLSVEESSFTTGRWLDVAFQAHLNEQAERLKRQQKCAEGQDDLVSKLTLLTVEKEEVEDPMGTVETVSLDVQNSPSQSKHAETLANSSLSSSALLSGISNRTTRVNIAKMRDRWWLDLREKKAKDAERAAEAKAKAVRQKTPLRHEDNNTPSSSTTHSSPESSVSSITSDDYSSSSSSDMEDNVPSCLSSKSPFHKAQCLDEATRSYLDNAHPLHSVIYNGDANALTNLLTLPSSQIQANASVGLATLGWMESNSNNKKIKHLASADTENLSPLQLAVYLDRPELIKIILDRNLSSSCPSLCVNTTDENNCTPLMLASELALDGCVRVLLSYGARLSTKTRTTGDTALHFCCRAGGETLTLRILLSASGNGSAQQRLVCSRNRSGQTPLHIACGEGKTPLVELFLSQCGVASSKALCMFDAAGRTPLHAAVETGSTDVVVHLLMWRGNHQVDQKKRMTADLNWNLDTAGNVERLSTTRNGNAKCCPMVLAVSTGSLEMVRLLLEFGDPSTSAAVFSYNLVGALHEAVSLTSSSSEKVEIIRLLIEAGANPYSTVDSKDAFIIETNAAGITPLSAAASRGDVDSLSVMIDTFRNVLVSKRMIRRQDPLLSKQPQAYFDKIEAREDSEIATSMRDALVRSLYLGWKDGRKAESHSSSNRLLASAVLFKKGATLDGAGFNRLERSLITDELHVHLDCHFPEQLCFEAKYIHYEMAGRNNQSKCSSYHTSPLHGWSDALLQLPWMWSGASDTTDTTCSWMRRELKSYRGRGVPKTSCADLFFLVVENERMVVHKSIVSAKSSKIAAAIHFSSLMHPDSDNRPIEVTIDLSKKMTLFLLQHCYHGCIFFGLPSDPATCADELLELALVAEEFLCPSLLLECEMRLISSDPYRCFCWYCCEAVNRNESIQRNDILGGDNLCINSVSCLYRECGPPRLLTGDCAFDVLAVLHQLGSSCRDDYLIKVRKDIIAFGVALKREWAVIDEISKPFCAAKAVAIKVILKQFESVLKSESFLSQCGASRSETAGADNLHLARENEEHIATLVLRMCLDELATSSLLRNRSLYDKLQAFAQIRMRNKHSTSN